MTGAEALPLDVFVVAAEESGDHIGAALMRALRERTEGRATFSGVGGHAMQAAGLASLYPIEHIAHFGLIPALTRLPYYLRRIRETARAAVVRRPDVMVIIDSPEFTHRIAARVRAAAPDIPIIDYVAPTAWAWRPRRARTMRAYVDHVLALLPFEPIAYRKLNGPPCTYVGHPLTERIAELRPSAAEIERRNARPPLLLVLPGSRGNEIHRLAGMFAQTVKQVINHVGDIEIAVPTVTQFVEPVRQAMAQLPVEANILTTPADKFAAFRRARVALAKSGTVTLELALAGVPMVGAYRLGSFESLFAGPVVRRIPSFILVNLVLGENVVPEVLNGTADQLAAELVPLFGDMPQRRRQIDAFARLDAVMEIGTCPPALRAADIVLATAAARRR